METKPLIEFKGRNGKIELYNNYVRLDRSTALGFMFHGLKGQKDIYFKSITSIQIKKPGLAVGYIQFSIPGGNESKRGVIGSISDENTLSFNGKENYEKALKIKEYIENKINAPEKQSSGGSLADELKKLMELKESGALTTKEFNKLKGDLIKK